MKKILSKTLLGAFAVAGILSTTAIVTSCGKNDPNQVEADTRIGSLIFEKNNQTIDTDFELAAKLGDYTVTWESSNAQVLKIGTEITSNATYKVTVDRSAITEKTEIKLTATVDVAGKKASKEFKVYVSALDVYDIAGDFKFDNENKVVWTTFDVPSKYTFQGKEATITWSSNNENAISFKDGKAVITPQEKRTEVKVTAKLSYNGEDCNKTYKLYVFHELTPSEKLYYWYEETGDSIAYDLRGYVVAKTGYDANYGNASIYIADETLTGGIYGYRVKIDKDTKWDDIQIGTRVEFTGATSTVYSGLIETNQNSATLKIITDDKVLEPLSADQLNELKAGKPIDDMIVLGDEDNYKYNYGNFVSLTSWKVKTVTDSKIDGSADGDLLVLTKGDKEIKVVLSKYMLDYKADATKITELVAAAKALKAGDYVTINGILSNKNELFIAVTNTSSIVSVETDNDESIAIAKEVKTAVEAIKVPQLVTENKEIDLKSFELPEGVEVSYALKDAKTTTMNDETGKITFVPTKEKENVELGVIVNVQNKYSYTYKIVITVVQLTDEEILEEAKKEFSDTVVALAEPTKADIAANSTNFPAVGLTYALKEENPNVVVDNENHVLTVLTTDKDYEFTLVVSFELNGKTASKEVKYSVAKYALTDYANTTNLGDTKKYYMVGEVTTELNNYGNTYIKDANGNKMQVYGLYDVAGNRYDKMGMTINVGDTILIYGEYVAQYTELKNAILVKYTEATDEKKAEVLVNKAAKLFAESYSVKTEITLPEGVSAASNSANVTVDGQKVTIDTTTAGEIGITLTGTVNGKSSTANVKVTIVPPKYYAVSNELIAKAEYNGDTTINLKDGADAENAGLINLDGNVFTVSSIANDASGAVGLNKAKNMRIYTNKNTGNGMALKIEVAEGKIIGKVKFSFASSGKGSYKVFNEYGIEVTADANGYYAINSRSFTIQNVTSGTTDQIHINSIDIVYGDKGNELE